MITVENPLSGTVAIWSPIKCMKLYEIEIQKRYQLKVSISVINLHLLSFWSLVEISSTSLLISRKLSMFSFSFHRSWKKW